MKSTGTARATIRLGQFLWARGAKLWHWALAASTVLMRTPEVTIRRTYVQRPGQAPRLLEEYQCFRLAGTRTEIRHGYYREYHSDGVQVVTAHHYRNGQRHGRCEDYAERGAQRYPVSMVHYKKGRRHGPAAVYAAWGKEQEGHHAHDLREGRWVNYRPNGSLDVCCYKAGRLHGEVVTYGPTGPEQSRLYYEHDKPVTGTRTEYYANGKARRIISYAAGRRQKWSQSWCGLGKLKPRPFFSALVQRLFYGCAPKPLSSNQPQLLFWSNSQVPKELG